MRRVKLKVKAYFLKKAIKESTKMTIAIILLERGAELILRGEYIFGGLLVAGWILLLINYAMVRVHVSR